MEGGDPDALNAAGHIGDVQWRPYSTKGPIEVEGGIRAVTLFDIPGLRELAATPGKHVVLVAGPCQVCKAVKANALHPLISQKSLRVCNHLITDVGTANNLLGLW